MATIYNTIPPPLAFVHHSTPLLDHPTPMRIVSASTLDSKAILTSPNFTPPSLPLTPPPSIREVYAPTALNRPTPVVPAVAKLPPVHSGSITENFRAALEGIDLEACEAHGENAFFVCDLAEVYRQHVRWQKELGKRVEPFFGELKVLFFVYREAETWHTSCQLIKWEDAIILDGANEFISSSPCCM